MYAIIATGGKQYKVSEGDVIRVEKLAVNEGEQVALDKVLVLGGDAGEREKLAQCYQKALDIARDHGFRSIAFPCISTGKFCFPKRLAAETALLVIRSHDYAGEVILCTHTDEEYAIYAECLGRSGARPQ